MLHAEIQKNIRHNITVNVLDACFFGVAMGFASSMTIIPLFLDTLTDNTALIGVLASMQMIGWQLPQILTANRVAKLARYKPMAMLMTLQERWPFFALALVALLLPTLGTSAVLALTVVLVCWKSLGGGFTGTVWQSMIGKIIPSSYRGTFWGVQTAGSTLMMAGAAPIAGILLGKIAYPRNYALCFLIASISMVVSWGFFSLTREPERDRQTRQRELSWSHLLTICRTDTNVWLFILARWLAQFGWMAVSFYTIFGTRHLGLTEAAAGAMLSVLTVSEAVMNPLLGWLGDSWGHRRAFGVGMLGMAGSAFLAMVASTGVWLYGAFALAGIGGAGIWTLVMTMTLEFGAEDERPYYIGLTNTLTAPATLVAPLIGGWLADTYGFEATFQLALVAALATAAVLLFVVRDPHRTVTEIIVTRAGGEPL